MERIQSLGKVLGIDVYYDQYQENNKFLFGKKGGSDIRFVVGNTKDLSIYEIAINSYNENHDKESN